MEPTKWATDRFGSAAEDLLRAIPLAVHRAHTRALTAHVSADMVANDAYGATLKVAQHEELIGAVGAIDGIRCRKPAGLRTRFELAVVEKTATVIFPLRYSTDLKHGRESARLRRPVSEFRATLLTLVEPADDGQLTLEQGLRDEDEMLAEIAEERRMFEQLAALGRVVTVGYGSNPASGVFGLGWGDLELRDVATGALHWGHWEDLTLPTEGEAGTARPSGPKPVADPSVRRFDDAPLDDDFGMQTRSPMAPPPESEPTLEPGETGSEPS